MANKKATTNNIIDSGLRADIMRNAMETKDVLTKKGSLYVGTGEQTEIVVSSDTYQIYKTAGLDIPSGKENYAFLSTNSSATNGLEWEDYNEVTLDSDYLKINNNQLTLDVTTVHTW